MFMLERIHIHNIGIIEDIELEFDDNINVLTGETGSGKSLIIDSISLVAGNRGNKEVIRNGCDEALIEACFSANIPDISEDNTIILSRKILANGKNVCKINGQMATLTQLKQVGDMLIDIHGQHDIVNLLDKTKYISLLDNYIGQEINDLKKEYIVLLEERKEIFKKQTELLADPNERNRKIDLLKYEIEEINNAHLQLDEEEKLIDKKNFFQNSEKIYSSLNETYNMLEGNVLNNLNACYQNMLSISQYNEKYMKNCDILQEAYYNLEEVNRDISQMFNDIDYNAEEKQRVFDRLDEIFNLKRKYGNTIKDILEYCEKIQNDLKELNSSNEIIEQLNKRLKDNTYTLFELSLKMHNIRNKKAKEIEQLVQAQMADLDMPKVKFDILVEFNDNCFEYDEQNNYNFTVNGLDEVLFVVCTNVGSKTQLISKIASGGELSRLMLALKIVFANSYNIPTIIFDEIDTGLSGQACVALAKKFKEISNIHQIILISHHANIAASGTNNILVKKKMDNGSIKSTACVLDENNKIQEIARILSGDVKTDIAVKHAIELIKQYK